MSSGSITDSDLKGLISSILEGDYTAVQVNELVHICHSLAISFLRNRYTNSSFLETLTGLNLNDVAFDGISDLFLRDDDNNFVQIKSYFDSVTIEDLTNKELICLLRRLICSKVHQSLHRIYGEYDPTLAKILRNVKLAVLTLRNFEEKERFGSQCITPVLADPLLHRPEIDSISLERELVLRTSNKSTIPDLLALMGCYLREQVEFCRIVPILTIAISIKSFYSRKEYSGLFVRTDDSLIKHDSKKIIQQNCQEVKNKMAARYVKKQNLEGSIYDTYFLVIEQYLVRIFCEDGEEVSLFEGFRQIMPHTTELEYRRQHKNRLEYLLRLCRSQTIQELKQFVE